MDGWLKIHRKMLHWEWFGKAEMVQLFMYLLLNANTRDTVWRGMAIKKGQLLRGRQRICSDLGMSVQQLRTCFSRLKKSGEIVCETVRKATDQGTLITICNYESYQDVEDDEQPTFNRPPTNLQPTSNQPPTIDKEGKKEKNISLSSDEDKVSSTRTREGRGKKKQADAEAKIVHQPGAKRKLKNGKDVSVYTRAQEIFMAYFMEVYEENYGWEAKDMVALKAIFRKIEFNRKNRRQPLPIDEENLLVAFEQFIRSINKEWIMDNFSLTTINSQYNNIISEIRNSHINGNRQQRANSPQAAGTAILVGQSAAVINDLAKADEFYGQRK